MNVHKLPNAAASKLAITATAATLYDLIDTAAGEAANLPSDLNALFLHPEDGDIRVLFDGNTPTAANGVLVSSGNMQAFYGVPLTKLRLIRTGGSDVACSVQVGTHKL